MKFAIKTMEKNIFFYSVLLCLYNVYKHQIGGNFNKKIDICFFKKCLEQKRGSQKVWLTAGTFTHWLIQAI